MTDEEKRTGGEPIFDTGRAWDRFERLAAREPVPAFWRRADEGRRSNNATTIEAAWDGNPKDHEKNGVVGMKQKTEQLRTAQRSSDIMATEGVGAAMAGGKFGAWRTERPAARRLRRLTAGVAAAVVAIGLIATPLGDRALAAMQHTFRIQHIVGVGISADDMATISGLLDSGSPEGDRSFNLAQYGTLTQSGGGEARTVTWEEAEERMGGSLLKPGNPAEPSFQPATTLTFQLNVKAVNRLLTRLGSSTTLPVEADGNAIRLRIPSGVAAEGTLSGKPVRLLQFGTPELTVDGGIDPATVREAVLGLPVLPDNLRTKLAAIGDWQSTLPIPSRDGVTTSLRLGGHDAVMTVDESHRYLLWLNGDRLSLLSGATNDFPAESDFRRAAEELIRS
ncbi:hypothetical protein [Paenibacillus arenilitoris]|uniref:DUF4367 domain-containing protein n=1 Tax=Paenibacillus arenilitoris TaxID=2772299 RepID=A0A927H620_9BACL|nr:hypothetical protein [Paenibacillus arenilitoris]MBD2869133.1 hypothetical protein [Paenibacillus arenilitoris]